MEALLLTPALPLLLAGPVIDLTPYNMDVIGPITAILLGVLEVLMNRLDDFNRLSSTPERCSSKKMPYLTTI
jgi:hypothetical protein